MALQQSAQVLTAVLPTASGPHRLQRLASYKNYTNLIDEDDQASLAKVKERIAAAATPVRRRALLYDFVRNWRAVQSTIVHFQLRNLVSVCKRPVCQAGVSCASTDCCVPPMLCLHAALLNESLKMGTLLARVLGGYDREDRLTRLEEKAQ